MAPPAASTSKRMHELPARRAEAAAGGADPVRDSIMEAMLEAAGEVGYREVAVRSVLERYGGHRIQFWERFAGKEECFALAHAVWMDRLATELLSSALAAGDWRRGMRAALLTLFRFVDERPALARALLIEAEIAGGAALAKREETVERLGEAIEAGGDRADPEDRPPPLTGLFVAGGIATYVSEQLAAGARGASWEGLPELMRFATAPYFGEEAADEEFEAARAIVDRLAAGKQP
jgi:AcrR family transcriptional regulator